MPHHHIQPEVIARQRQSTAAGIPDRHGEGAAQQWPDVVAELFPASEYHARVRPFHCVLAPNSDPRQQFIAIVDACAGGDQSSARALLRLAIEAIFGGYPHQCVHEADRLAHAYVGSIGAVLPKRTCSALKLTLVSGPAIESHQSGDRTHKCAPPNSARRVYATSAPPASILSLRTAPQASTAKPRSFRATPRQSRLAIPRRRSIACAASARGRQSALIQGFAAAFSTAHATQFASSPAKRLMRRGGRLAQEKMRAGGITRTASRARIIITAASRRYARLIVFSFIAPRPVASCVSAVAPGAFEGKASLRARLFPCRREYSAKGCRRSYPWASALRACSRFQFQCD